MQITDVRIRTVNNGKLKARASVTFNNFLAVHDIRIVESANGTLFMAMPSVKSSDGIYKNIVHPINSEAREQIFKAVMQEYNKELSK